MKIINNRKVFDNIDEYIQLQISGNKEKDFIGNTTRPWIDDDISILVKYIRNKNARILSIGCRDFYDLRCLRKLGYNNLIGCDIDQRCDQLAKKLNIPFVQCDIHEHKFNEKFDVIYMRHVLEHLYDPDKAMINICNHIKPGGYIMVVVPLESKFKKDSVHCLFFETSKKFKNYCSKFFDVILCDEDNVSKKSPQVRILGKVR